MDTNSDLLRSIESYLGVSISSNTLVLITTTSVAIVVGLLVFVWKKSIGGSKEFKPVVLPKSLMVEADEDEAEVPSGKTKLSIFFGTQTGTAEGFAKFSEYMEKKIKQLELMEKRLQETEAKHAEELAVERRKQAELEVRLIKAETEGEAALKAEKEARVLEKGKAEACIANLVEKLEKSSPVLRLEVARTFMKSRTYLELLAKESINDQTRTLETVVGQLKKRSILPADFDQDEIDLSLDGNLEPLPLPEHVDERILEEDEFFELYSFDFLTGQNEDSFVEAVNQLKKIATSEAREAGLILPSGGSINSENLGGGGASRSSDASSPAGDQ